MRLQQVYLLIDPITDEVCYVGSSSRPLRRLKEHLKTNDNIYFSYWAGWLEDHNTRPTVRCVTGLISSKKAKKEEDAEIKRQWANGAPLLNVQSIPLEDKTSILPRIENSQWYKKKFGE